LNLTIPPIKTT